MYLKAIFIFISQCNENFKFLIKVLMSVEIKGCLTWFNYILDLLYSSYNFAKFHHCWICITDFKKGAFLPPTREQPRKGPSWIGLMMAFVCWHFLKQLFKSIAFTHSNIWKVLRCMFFVHKITFFENKNNINTLCLKYLNLIYISW